MAWPSTGPRSSFSNTCRRAGPPVRSPPRLVSSPTRPRAVTSAPPLRIPPIRRFANEEKSARQRSRPPRGGRPRSLRTTGVQGPGREDLGRGQRERGHVGRRLRRGQPVRPHRRRQEGRRAERHRASAGLGQLRGHHQGVRRQVRHQGQLGPAGRCQPGGDQRRHPAEGQVHRARRLRPRSGRRTGQHRDVRALQGGEVRRDLRGDEGPRRRLGQRLRRLHVDRLRLGQGARDQERRTISSAPTSRARSRSTATRPRPARRSPAS